jgi:hypothetical protein
MGVILPPKGKTWFTGGSKRKEGRKEGKRNLLYKCMCRNIHKQYICNIWSIKTSVCGKDEND